MATAVAEIDFIPDDEAPAAIDFIPDEADDAIEFIPDEVIAEEAQRATTGAVQALDVMQRIGQADWSDANEQMDAERFRESEGLRAQGQPEQAAALAKEITPFTTTGQYLAQQRAGEAQGAAEVASTTARGGATPSEALARGLGPGLAPIGVPIAEGAARQAGPAVGGILGAAKFIPHPGARILSQVLMPMAGALLGAQAGGGAQEALLQVGETPEETQARQQRAAEDQQRNPGLTMLGGTLASGPFVGPSIAQFRRAAAGDVGAMANIGLGGALSAGGAIASAAMRGDFASMREISEAFVAGSIMNEPTKLGRKLGLKPSSEQQAIEDATIRNEQPPIRIGGDAEPTSDVGTIAGMRRGTLPRVVESRVIETPVVESPITSDIPGGVLNKGAEQTPAPRTDEQRIAELVDAGMTPEDAASNLAKVKAAEAPAPVAEPTRQTVKVMHAGAKDVQFEPGREAWFTDSPQNLEIYTNPEHPLHWNQRKGREQPVVTEAEVTGRFFGSDPTDMDTLANSIASKMRVVSEDRGGLWLEAYGRKIYSRENVPEAAIAKESRRMAERVFGRTEEGEIIKVQGWDILNDAGFDAVQTDVDYSPGAKNYVVQNPEQIQKSPAVEVPPPARPAPPAAEPVPAPEGATSNKEAVVNAERAERALDPVVKEARLENKTMIDYAEDALEIDPARPQKIIDRLRSAPPEERNISTADAAILLIERTKLRSRRDAALVRAGRKEGTAMEKAIAQAEFDAVEGALNQMDQAAQDARSTWGRFGQLWQRSMREDFSLVNLERRARLAKDGPLNEKDITNLTKLADKAAKAHEDFDIRAKQVELENKQNAIDAKIEEVKARTAPIDPAVKSIADRIVARLDIAAKNAEKSLREKLFNLGSAPDPTIVLEVAKIAAARTAKAAIEFGQWSAEMVKNFGEKVRPFLQAGWDQREQHIDSAINAGGGTKKKQVAAKIKAPKASLNAAAQQARIEQAIGERIKEGKPLSSLAPYVNKLQESFIAQGIETRDGLIDAVHGTLQKHEPSITRDDAMEIMSKYGSDYATPLSKDPIKQTRRQLDGEIQQLLKLRDIASKTPLPKSGPERPTPGATWRNLIKQVNAAKKKMGVVVTDPETQLKSSQDAIRTRLRNDIEDMTLELETGVKRPEQTPAEYAQDMEILKGVRDRIRETLNSIEGNPSLTDEQRIAMAKRSAEGSLAMWERRLAGEQAKVRKGVTNPEIEAIKAKRDAVKAQVEEIDAADATLQENRKAEALVRQIENTEKLLTSNAVRMKAQGADSELVAEARKQLAAVRNALNVKNSMDPQRQMEAIERAERTLEASIRKLDADLQAGNIAPAAKKTGPQSERLAYLRAQRDAMNALRAQLRNEAKPRLSADALAIKSFTSRALARAAELRRRMADGDFGPRTRKPPVDISGDPVALAAQADLMAVQPEFAKMQEQWKLDQMNWTQKAARGVGQAWDATANMFLSMDLSTPLQTAVSMAAHPVEAVKAIGKGAEAFRQQFFKWSDDYARREAARIANSPNSKNGLYKQMKLELPSALGKAREENMSNIMERLADLDARWAGLPDVVKGLYRMEGKTLIKGGKRLAALIPKLAGSSIKASNAAFETIANTMRARTADAMLARWYGPNRGAPTKQQLELMGEWVNIATGKGGLRAGDSARRIFFAPNYYLSIMKQLSGWQLLKAGAWHHEGKVTKDIAKEYIRAIATMGSIYGLNALFGNEIETDPQSKNVGRVVTDQGTTIDLSMGRGAWIAAATQIATGERVNAKGRVEAADRGGTAMAFARGRLSRGVASSLTSAFGKDYKGKETTGIEIAKDFVIPLGWRDFDDLLEREGLTRGAFIQLLNILGVTHKIAE